MREFRVLLAAAAGLGLAAFACGDAEPEAEPGRGVELVRVRTLGLAYLEENRLPRAEEQFERLTELAPEESVGWANLALVHLRQGRNREALEEARRAAELSPEDPEIRALKARLLQLTGDTAAARRELERALAEEPGHGGLLYALSEVAASRGGDDAARERAELLERILDRRPANLAARLQLVDARLEAGAATDALPPLEGLPGVFPRIPADVRPLYERAMSAARRGDAGAARAAFGEFHSRMRVTAAYQEGMEELGWPGEAAAGVPEVTFSPETSRELESAGAVREAMRFTDATALAGLAAVAGGEAERAGRALAAEDLEGDGDVDVVAATADAGEAAVLRNELGAYDRQPARLRAEGCRELRGAAAGDYDNDGLVDLFLACRGESALFRAEATELRRAARGEEGVSGSARGAVWADLDHDGDLDLFVYRDGPNRVYRNNLDGTFTERAAEMGLAGGPDADTRGAAYGDFDGDADLDLVTWGENGVRLYANGRGGRFREATAEAGLEAAAGGEIRAVAAGDVDGNGGPDLLLAGDGGAALWLSDGEGSFRRAPDAGGALGRAAALGPRSAAFLDADNDGHLDLAVAGEGGGQGGGSLLLLLGDGEGGFEAAGDLLPDGLPPLAAVRAGDYNEDGDLDLYLLAADGRPLLLRNDGGNANRFLKLRLTALATGSGKNNRFGIGARVEVRSGDLYQTRVVDGAHTHFGLGTRRQAEAVRIRWPNGVPQTLHYPEAREEFVEEQELKGSCAFLYAWDGEEFSFVTDVMWRSALGMPLGIMGESRNSGRSYAPAGPSREYVRFPGSALRPRDGELRLSVTEELWETAYLDELRLVAVDHPDSVEVFVNEAFRPPGPPNRRLYPAASPRTPASAATGDGRDVLELVARKDDRYVAGFAPGRYQGTAEMHELALDLGDLEGARRVSLYLNGWVYPTDASINVSISQSTETRVLPPALEVPDGEGGWRTAVPDLGFPAGKDKTVVAELTGADVPDDGRVRVRTNMEVYWDHVFFAAGREASPAAGAAAAPLRRTTLRPARAELRYRGFSRTYRKGGRHGPHWFDYQTVSREPRWLPIPGRYTRLGDVLPLVRDADDRYVVMAPGDEVRLGFPASELPPLPERWSRTWLVYTEGWIKDADLNTATGGTVEPLPFHGMSEYPYGPGEAYPSDPASRAFVEEYLTRTMPSRLPPPAAPPAGR